MGSSSGHLYWPDPEEGIIAGNDALELFCGGATRDRTADLLHAMQALSQLSYSPFTEPRILEPDVAIVNKKQKALRLLPSSGLRSERAV